VRRNRNKKQEVVVTTGYDTILHDRLLKCTEKLRNSLLSLPGHVTRKPNKSKEKKLKLKVDEQWVRSKSSSVRGSWLLDGCLDGSIDWLTDWLIDGEVLWNKLVLRRQWKTKHVISPSYLWLFLSSDGRAVNSHRADGKSYEQSQHHDVLVHLQTHHNTIFTHLTIVYK